MLRLGHALGSFRWRSVHASPRHLHTSYDWPFFSWRLWGRRTRARNWLQRDWHRREFNECHLRGQHWAYWMGRELEWPVRTCLLRRNVLELLVEPAYIYMGLSVHGIELTRQHARGGE